MKHFTLDPRWLASDLDDPCEAATFAEIALCIAGEPLARLEDPVDGSLSEGTRVPALPLALGLAQRWWRLLFEPEKRSDRRTEAKHRLDVLTPGYVFPPLALWSGGDDAILARLMTLDPRFQRVRFTLPDRAEPWYLERTPVEACLAAFVDGVIARLSPACAGELRDAWGRVQQSRADAAEAAWCMAAGRLGFDPYDAATPDIDSAAGGLETGVFAQLSEAATWDELPEACQWVAAKQPLLAKASTIDLAGLGAFPQSDPDDHPAHQGYQAAVWLRQRLGREHPRDVIRELIGACAPDRGTGPAMVQGLTHQRGTGVAALVRARDDAQARFRLCHAVFLAWETASGEYQVVSTAKTRRQQAARAFAAEVLAPTPLLRERTTGDVRPKAAEVESWADDFGTTPHVVQEQLWNRLRLTAHSPA